MCWWLSNTRCRFSPRTAENALANSLPSVTTERPEEVEEILKTTSQQYSTTILCSLHQVEYAMEVADRIIGFAKGRVVYDGVPEDLTIDILEEIYEGSSHTPVLHQVPESFDTLLARQTLADPSVRVEIIV